MNFWADYYRAVLPYRLSLYRRAQRERIGVDYYRSLVRRTIREMRE
jgi:hypothetical protein